MVRRSMAKGGPQVGLYIRARSGSFLPRSDCRKPAPPEQGTELGVAASTCAPSTQEVVMEEG